MAMLLARGSRYLLIYLGFVLLLFALLVGSLLISDERIADQLVSARQDGEFSAQNWTSKRPAHLEDKFADCFGSSQGLGNDSALSSALRSPNLGSCPSANLMLDEYEATGELTQAWEYFRYWHGYAIVTRPLLAVLGMAFTRHVLTLSIAASAAAVAFLTVRRTRDISSGFLVVPLVVTTDLLWMASSIPTAVGVVASLIGPIVVLSGPRLSELPDAATDDRVMQRVFLAGGLVAYADLLSVGPIGWALTVFAITLMLPRRDLLDRRSVKLTVAGAGAWMGGYGATWAAKWVLTSFDLGTRAVWDDVTNEVAFRLDGEHELVEPGFLATSRKTFDYWLDQPFAGHVLFLTAAVFAGSLYVARTEWRTWARRFAVLASPALLIVLWYEVVRNHSQIHHWLTYRYWAVFMGIIIVASLRAGVTTKKAEGGGPVLLDDVQRVAD